MPRNSRRIVLDHYPIVDVRLVAGEDALAASSPTPAALQQSEQMGSKRKFWWRDPGTSRWHLFKYSRDNTGEHWSEKVASEIASLLGLPHASVELASHDGAHGVVVLDVRSDRERMGLLHGNELLLELDPSYPNADAYRVSGHTVARVARALSDHDVQVPRASAFARALPAGVDDALGLFVGYLMLDAIIGNTDRHHENWAVVSRRDAASRVLELAPTYDHASSLGRELSDAKRETKRRGSGEHGVEAYARRARSALYRASGEARPLSPVEAFLAAGELRPAAREAWLSRCAEIGPSALATPLARLPTSVASQGASTFADALIRYNFGRLLSHLQERLR